MITDQDMPIVNGWTIAVSNMAPDSTSDQRSWWQRYFWKFWAPKPKYYNRRPLFYVLQDQKTVLCNPAVIGEVRKYLETHVVDGNLTPP